MKDIVILGSLNKSRQRRCVFDIYSLCPTLTAAMGMGGGMMPYIIETSKYEPIGSLAIHNSKRFNPGYMEGIFKCIKVSKYDIGVLYERK